MKDTTTVAEAIMRVSDADHDAKKIEREITRLMNEQIAAKKAKAEALDGLAATLKEKLGPHTLGDLLRRFRGHPALQGPPADTDNFKGGVP